MNILTHLAVLDRRITVFGGDQQRPNIHIEDMAAFYQKSLEWPDAAIDGRTYNVGYENHTVRQIAEMVREEVGSDVEIVTTPTDDHRTYDVSSEKIRREPGFTPTHTIQDAIRGLVAAFADGRIHDSKTNDRYYHIKTMQRVGLR